MRQKCSLVLSHGQRFEGDLIGAPVLSSGELVFTTGMVGYSEAITDPSYFGQILAFTYPLIGNYGIPHKMMRGEIPLGFESHASQAAAIVLSMDSPEVFHWESFQSLDNWLKDEGIPGIVGIDTRHLVHLIRSVPNLLGKIVPTNPLGVRYESLDLGVDPSRFYDPGQHQIISQVSVKAPMYLGSGSARIGVIDCGIKWNIVRRLLATDCEVVLIPWDADFARFDVDGWLISNGPGDPMKTGNLTQKIASLFKEDRPLLGICLGHQLMSIAAGASTSRMGYGHRSHNQPVYEVATRRGFMTTQNHGYVVDSGSIPPDWEPWFRNANDESIEGIRHRSKPFQSVQFHPEASGGPRDTAWILEHFVAEVKS